MCGIAGIWNLNGEQLAVEKLRAFTDSLAHRGPDGAGYELMENGPGLGHRRLSIIDLSDSGKQPMWFKDRYCITFNGELYNFIELREELEKKGYIFRSSSDTEVILAAYDHWGNGCFLKFNGMWAMGIWDVVKRKLILCRDRFGVKPLYYFFGRGKQFAFASETIAFKLMESARKINSDRLIMNINNINSLEGTGYTIFENIFQLLPGHLIEIGINAHEVKQKKWWNLQEHLPSIPSSFDKQVEVFSDLFEEACKLRLRSDVPVATALSGGLDSSSVYGTIRKILNSGKKITRAPGDFSKAFTAVFPGSAEDERQYAAAVLDFYKAKGDFIVNDPSQLTDEIISSTLLFDTISTSPLPAISGIYKAMAKQGIKVSLDGHGVDEMMYGYPFHSEAAYFTAMSANDLIYAEDILETYGDLFPPDQKEMRIELLKKKAIANSSMISSMGKAPGLKKIAKKLLTKINRKNKEVHLFPTDLLAEVQNRSLYPLSDRSSREQLSYAEKILYDDFHFYSLPVNLRDFDRASMQHGVEIRMPFMDWKLVSFIFALPMSSKIGGGFTKRILRKAMEETLPKGIVDRKLKIGINAPNDIWFNEYLKDFVLDIVNSDGFLNFPLWDGRRIGATAESNYKSSNWSKSEAQQIWAFINAYCIVSNAKRQ